MITDQQILEQIRSGTNQKALVALYRHLPGIRKMIRRYGGNRQQAEDIFQESLIILCRKAREDAFVLSSDLYAYLYSICRFLWMDELKKTKRNNAGAFEEITHEVAEPGIAEAVAEEARFRLVEDIITGLGDRCRELLLMFYNQGIRLRDIAARMGYSSEQTAKNQKYKCLEGARNKYRQLRETITSL